MTIPAGVLFLLVMPVLVGRAFGSRLVRHWPVTARSWARLWRGRLGELTFRLAGIGLRGKQQPVPAALATEALVAGAAVDLFHGLPQEYRVRLEEVPDLVGRLESAANVLRKREAELDRALGTVGTVGFAVDRPLRDEGDSFGPDGLGSVQSHRARAAEDLELARNIVGGRLSGAVAALENLRLGLLRLQAGVGTPDELTAELRVAREIGREVEALLEGDHQIEELLGDPQESRDLQSIHQSGTKGE